MGMNGYLLMQKKFVEKQELMFNNSSLKLERVVNAKIVFLEIVKVELSP